MKINKEAIIESLKEAGRVIVLAVIPVLIAQLEEGFFNWKIILVVAVVAVLRMIDKYLHLKEPEGISGGLTRF